MGEGGSGAKRLRCRCSNPVGGGGGVINCHLSSESGTPCSFESASEGEGEEDTVKVACKQFGPGLPQSLPLLSQPAPGAISLFQGSSQELFSRSVVSDSLRPHGLQHTRLPCPSPSLGVRSLKLMSFKLVMPSNHLILCCPLFLLPSIFPSIRVFSNESALCIKWPKYWSFSFSISPSNEYFL